MNPQDYDLSLYDIHSSINSNSFQSYYPSSFDSQSIPCYYDETLYLNDDEILFDEELISTLQDLDNYEHISQDGINPNISSNQPKKRLSAEARAKKNKRRRAHAFPRILKRDIRREYMNYFVNVTNSADIPLILKYLNRYYHPNVILTKLDLNNSTTLKIQGREVLSNLFVSTAIDMPDHTTYISNARLKINRKTNRSLIQSDFTIHATKVKSSLGHLEALVQRMKDIIDRKDLSSELQPLVEEKEDKNPEETTLIITKELTQNDFFYHHMSVTNNQRKQLNEQLKEFATSYHSIYQKNIDDFKTNQMEANAISCATNQSLHLQEPILCLNPPIKSSFKGNILMYLDESYMISHIEMHMLTLTFEPLLV